MRDYCFSDKNYQCESINYYQPQHSIHKPKIECYHINKVVKKKPILVEKTKLHESFLREPEILRDFNYKYFKAKEIFFEFFKKSNEGMKIFSSFINTINQKINLRNKIDKVYFLIDFLLGPKIEKMVFDSFFSIINKFIFMNSDEILANPSINLERFDRFSTKYLEIEFKDQKEDIEEPLDFYIFSNLDEESFIISEEIAENLSEDLRKTQSDKKGEIKPFNFKYKIIDKTKD